MLNWLIMPMSVSPNLAKHYTSYYEDDISEWRTLGAIDKSRNIISLCSPYPHNTILEVGCGDGAVMRRLMELGFAPNVSGLEISSSAVERMHQRGLKCNLFDGYTIPSLQEHADLAILTHVVEHVEFPRKLIYESMKKCDFLFVEVPLEDNMRLPRDYFFDPVGHINFYSPKTIRRLLQTCNLHIVNEFISHSSLPAYCYRLGELKGRLNYVVKNVLLQTVPRAATQMFTYHYSAICKPIP